MREGFLKLKSMILKPKQRDFEEVNVSLTNVYSQGGLNKQVLDQLNIEISTLSHGLSDFEPAEISEVGTDIAQFCKDPAPSSGMVQVG